MRKTGLDMPRQIPEEKLQAIEAVVTDHPEGIGVRDIAHELDEEVARRTLQYRLKHLVDEGRLTTEGEVKLPVSRSAANIQKYVCQPVAARKPAGYNRKFLDAYRPNATVYLSEKERAHLKEVGTPATGEQPAGTYAQQILKRLLIDLSWNSSRLEGNTYSLLDTKRLIDFGEEAEGKERIEAQMILNHKDAIEFLVGSAEEIGFNRHTILNLHALLANNLLAGPRGDGPVAAHCSRHREISVPPARSTAAHRGMLRTDSSDCRRHQGSIRAILLHDGAVAVSAAVR